MQRVDSDSSVELVSECAPVDPERPHPQAHNSPIHLTLDGNPTAWLSGNYGKGHLHKLVRMTSLCSEVISDDSSELPTPYREDITLEAEPEVDKLDRMLSLLREEDREELSGMLPGEKQAAHSKDDMYLILTQFSGHRRHCFTRRRAQSCSFPSITEEEEGEGGDGEGQCVEREKVQIAAKDEQGGKHEEGVKGSLYINDLKGLTSGASPHSTGNGTQMQGNPLLATTRHSWGHPNRSRNSILMDMLGDSSGSEGDQPAARRMLWRQTQSLHSVSSSEEGGVMGLLGARNEMDAEEMLISLGFCDFDSPELIPDRLIPDTVAHARPSMMAQETVDEEPPLTHVETTNEVPEELELSLPLGATAEDVCLSGQVKGRVRSTAPIPISALPDTPYYPFYLKGQPLDTVMEETDSQLSPIPGSPKTSPRTSLDQASSDSKQATGTLLSVPPMHRASLPSMAPSREGYKVGVDIPSRDVCKLGVDTSTRDARRLSMDSHHSYQSADTIYFSVTSYDDNPDQAGGGVEGNIARSRSGSRSPSPRLRRKVVATPPPPSTVLKWLNSQMEDDVGKLDQPWPFSELLSQEMDGSPEREVDGGSDIHLIVESCKEATTLPSGSESSGSYTSCQADLIESSSSHDTGSFTDAVDCNDFGAIASHTHQFSQSSTVVDGVGRSSEDGSGLHRVSSASTITMSSSSLHRLSADSSITLVNRSLSGSPHHEQNEMGLSGKRISLSSHEQYRTPHPNAVEVEEASPQSRSQGVDHMLQTTFSTSVMEHTQEVSRHPLSASGERRPLRTAANPTANSPTEAISDHTPSTSQPVAHCMSPHEADTPPCEVDTPPHEADTPPCEVDTHLHHSKVLADSSVTSLSGTACDERFQVLGASCVVPSTVRSSPPHRQPMDGVARQAVTQDPTQCEGPLPHYSVRAEEEIPQSAPTEIALRKESRSTRMQVSELINQIALLREVVEQKDSTIDELTRSHGIEAGELRKQAEDFRRQQTETRESLFARLTAMEEERDSLSLLVKDTESRYKTHLASMEQQLKKRASEELFDLKAKLNREKQVELSKVSGRAQRDLDDLKQQLTTKTQDVVRLRSFAHEREGAADALAEELRQLRKESLDREAKLKESLQSEVRRAEKQLSREKALTVMKTQEAAAAYHQRELVEVKDQLTEEKQTALAEQKQRHTVQVEELTRKLQVREEERRSLLSQLEESRQSVAAAREEASRQLKQQLREMRGALETERQQNRLLLSEKQAAMIRAREAAQSLEEDMPTLQARLEREHRSEVDRLQEKLARAEGEVVRRRGREQELQQREKELALQLEDEGLELMRSVSEECQRVALLLGRRHSRHLPPGSSGPRAPELLLPSNRMSAVSLLRNSVEDLRQYVSELKQQADRDRAAVAKMSKEKVTELRQLRTELQIDKSRALKAQEERLSRVLLGGAAEQTSRGCQTREGSGGTHTDMATAQLETSLKDEQQQSERMRALLSERGKECATLQQQLKQLSKEHLILQKKVNSSNAKP